ncbi:MAG: tRNA glutamyl-Q synthetase, partial [Bacteroidetes bacterium]
AKGSLRLRIDDIDAPRARPEYIEDIFYTLDWLGLDYDEGPSGPDELARSYSQQHNTELYLSHIQLLTEKGHTFVCRCSRKEMLAHSSDGQYPGTCRNLGLAPDTPDSSLRLRTPEDVSVHWQDLKLRACHVRPWEQMRDVVLRRRDGIPAYQIASVCDDLKEDINLIVRGEDLLPSTGVQLWLAECMGAPGFGDIRFLHHPLLRDSSGEKLSKSAGAFSLKALRESGKGPEGVFSALASLMGWGEAGSLEELAGFV